MRIAIEIDLLDEFADDEHDSGLTNEGFEILSDAIMKSGIAEGYGQIWIV